MTAGGAADRSYMDDREFDNWLRSRGVNAVCPWCQHRRFRIGDSPLAASVDDGSASGAMTLICEQCGHIGIFAPSVLLDREHDEAA